MTKVHVQSIVRAYWLIQLFVLVPVCDGVVFVNESETATVTVTGLPTNTDIYSPGEIRIIQKVGDVCSLKVDSNKYLLLETSCVDSLTFKIKQAGASDAGYYKCSNLQCQEKLVVFGNPTKPVISPSKDELIAGEDITLTCSSQSTTKPSDHQVLLVYTWLQDGIKRPETTRLLPLLAVNKTMLNTSFTCIVRENLGMMSVPSDEYTLLPRYREALMATVNGNSSTAVTLVLGDNVNYTCHGDGYPTLTTLVVQFDGSTVHRESTTNMLLYTKITQCSDNRVFRCRGYSSFYRYGRVDSNSIKIQVPCPPELIVQKPIVFYSRPAACKYWDIRFWDYSEVVYTVHKITQAGLIPLPIDHQVETRTHTCRISFCNFDSRVFGTYQLKAENVEGSLFVNFTVAGPPEEPKNLLSWSSTPNSAHVSWVAGEDYGLPQKYYLYRREADTLWRLQKTYEDSGKIITITETSLKPATKYYFRVTSTTPGGSSFNSEITEVITIKPGDKQQDQPSRTSSSSDKTSSPATPLPSKPLTDVYTDTTPTSYLGTGIGIGLAIGVVLTVGVTLVIIYILKSRGRSHYTEPTPVPEPAPHYVDLINDSEGGVVNLGSQ